MRKWDVSNFLCRCVAIPSGQTHSAIGWTTFSDSRVLNYIKILSTLIGCIPVVIIIVINIIVLFIRVFLNIYLPLNISRNGR